MEKCKKGKHTLVEVWMAQHQWDGSAALVMWCSVCGAIVVDLEIDSRVYPGKVKKMQYTDLFKKELDSEEIKQ